VLLSALLAFEHIMHLKWPALLAGTVAVAVVAVFVQSRSKVPQAVPDGDAQSQVVTVSVATVERRDLPIVIRASGRAEAKASVTVKSRLDGQVAAILFTEGGVVRKGQVLVRMDAAPAQAQLRQSSALLARDRAQLEKLQADRDRNTELFHQGFISKSGLGQTEADFRSAEATLKADQASIDSARLQLEFTNVLAPMDGVAGVALLPIGGAAKANDTPLVVVNQVTPIHVAFAVPEGELGRVKAAMARGPVEVVATVPGASTISIGRLEFLDNAVDASTGTIMARALFANSDRLLTPGQYAEVTITLGHRPGSLVVPVAALESGVDGPFVFVVRADSTVEIRAVKTGESSEGFAPVTSGLAVGERVVTDGQARLRAGSAVRIAPTAPTSR
jgi:multidrug efflux system membrane fusion protein